MHGGCESKGGVIHLGLRFWELGGFSQLSKLLQAYA